jgi:hypothetical protein
MFKGFKMKIALLARVLFARFNMSDADAAAQDPSVDADDQATITVPAAHVGLFERVVALLKKDEQTIVDNIHAGVSALEAMFKSKDDEDKAPPAA